MVPIDLTFLKKNTKLPSPGISKTPKRYKQNTISSDIHRSKRISSIFDGDISLAKKIHEG